MVCIYRCRLHPLRLIVLYAPIVSHSSDPATLSFLDLPLTRYPFSFFSLPAPSPCPIMPIMPPIIPPPPPCCMAG